MAFQSFLITSLTMATGGAYGAVVALDVFQSFLITSPHVKHCLECSTKACLDLSVFSYYFGVYQG